MEVSLFLASITSRAASLRRMKLPMRSLRRWNQTTLGQHFPSRTMKRRGKLFSPFFLLLSDQSDCGRIHLRPQRCNYWSLLFHLILQVLLHPQPPLWQVNLRQRLQFPLNSPKKKKKLSVRTRWPITRRGFNHRWQQLSWLRWSEW